MQSMPHCPSGRIGYGVLGARTSGLLVSSSPLMSGAVQVATGFPIETGAQRIRLMVCALEVQWLNPQVEVLHECKSAHHHRATAAPGADWKPPHRAAAVRTASPGLGLPKHRAALFGPCTDKLLVLHR